MYIYLTNNMYVTLLTSFFLPSHLSFKNMYMYMCTCILQTTCTRHVQVHVPDLLC